MGRMLTQNQQTDYIQCFKAAIEETTGQAVTCGRRAMQDLCTLYNTLPKLKKSLFWDVFHEKFKRLHPDPEFTRSKL